MRARPRGDPVSGRACILTVIVLAQGRTDSSRRDTLQVTVLNISHHPHHPYIPDTHNVAGSLTANHITRDGSKARAPGIQRLTDGIGTSLVDARRVLLAFPEGRTTGSPLALELGPLQDLTPVGLAEAGAGLIGAGYGYEDLVVLGGGGWSGEGGGAEEGESEGLE